MIINHPLLGPRDAQEFSYLGDASLIDEDELAALIASAAPANKDESDPPRIMWGDPRVMSGDPQLIACAPPSPPDFGG